MGCRLDVGSYVTRPRLSADESVVGTWECLSRGRGEVISD
jgi:hypothetical protein